MDEHHSRLQLPSLLLPRPSAAEDGWFITFVMVQLSGFRVRRRGDGYQHLSTWVSYSSGKPKAWSSTG